MSICTLLLVPSAALYSAAKMLSHSQPDYRQHAAVDSPAAEAEPLIVSDVAV